MDLEVIKIAENTINYKSVKNYSHKYKHKNAICGDEIEITLKIKNKKIIDFGYKTKSCIYCQASASLLSRKSKNIGINEVNKFLNIANILFQNNHIQLIKHWKSFDKILKKENLQRKECLLLPINALIKILKNYDE
tara:strand:- start:165 stop:572 length:408 start_codon:yes stop_codon:yes gene_type:complete